MAKELPYFKFESQAWDTGNVQMCSRESKGLFIDLCSLYWSRLGELPYALALQKLCNGNKDALQELIDHEIIGIFDGQIVIEFLDEQLDEFNQTSEKRRIAANKRWKDASALQLKSKSNAIREDKRREDKIKEEDIVYDFSSNPSGLFVIVKDGTRMAIKIHQQSFDKWLDGTFGAAYEGQRISLRSKPPIAEFFKKHNGNIFNDNQHVWSSLKKIWISEVNTTHKPNPGKL